MNTFQTSRRKFISRSGLTLACSTLPGSLSRALAAKPEGTSLSAVKHVVIFMQENRSFDHYFGTLQGVRGFDDCTARKNIFAQANGANTTLLPFRLDTTRSSAQCVADLIHGWDDTHQAWANGNYNNWVAAKTPLTMGYLTRNDLAYHYALADAFTICDHYFSSVMGPTDPNRLYLWTGMIDPLGIAGGPVISNDISTLTWTTYPERLQQAGVSWQIYQNAKDNYGDNPLEFFANYRRAEIGNPLHDRGMASVPAVSGNTVQDIAKALRDDVLNDRLPAVSWIIAPQTASEHPSSTPANGAYMIDKVMEALTADPKVWASTVLLLNYDENDGFFDHLIPPTPPRGTSDEFVNGQPVGLGPRVPMIVISPWSRGGYVNSQLFDHTSVLRFLEVWTGVSEPNISSWRRKVCGDLTSAFNFSSLSLSVPKMPATTLAVLRADAQCLLLPAAQPPLKPSMPTQEPGRRLARGLPYQPNGRVTQNPADATLTIHISNAGMQAVHFSLYSNLTNQEIPRQYSIDGNSQHSDQLASVSVSPAPTALFDYSLHGPNGFLRQFAGDLRGPGRAAEVAASYDFSTSNALRLVLTLSNTGEDALVFTFRFNNYRSPDSEVIKLAGGSSTDISWDIHSDGWYDFTTTISADPTFLRRFAGHVELGRDSVTG